MKAGRIVTLLLILALLVTLGGCGAPEKKDSADSAASSAAGSQVVVHTDPYTDVTGKKVGISMPAQTDPMRTARPGSRRRIWAGSSVPAAIFSSSRPSTVRP